MNCEDDSLLARVQLEDVAACHEGYRTCYFRRWLDAASEGFSAADGFVAAADLLAMRTSCPDLM